MEEKDVLVKITVSDRDKLKAMAKRTGRSMKGMLHVMLTAAAFLPRPDDGDYIPVVDQNIVFVKRSQDDA